MKAISYARVSTQTQATKGSGLERQADYNAAYAEKHGIEIVGEVREVLSGVDFARPGMLETIAALEAGVADTVLIEDPDRLARSVEAYDILTQAIREAGGTIRYTAPWLNGSN